VDKGRQVKEELKKITEKRFKLTSLKLKDLNLTYLVATSICRQIRNGISYRRAIKMAIAASMRMNAEGIKV
jgi:small subunit ribosomal protein S3